MSASSGYFRVKDPNYTPAPRVKAFTAGKAEMETIRNYLAAGQVLIKNKDQLKDLPPGSFVGLNKRKIKYRGGFVFPYANSFVYVKEYPNRDKLKPTRKQVENMLIAAEAGKQAGKAYRDKYPKGTKVPNGKEIFKNLLKSIRKTPEMLAYIKVVEDATDEQVYVEYVKMQNAAAAKKKEKKTATKQDLQNIIMANQAASAAFQQQHGFPITEVKTPMRKQGEKYVGQTKASKQPLQFGLNVPPPSGLFASSSSSSSAPGQNIFGSLPSVPRQ